MFFKLALDDSLNPERHPICEPVHSLDEVRRRFVNYYEVRSEQGTLTEDTPMVATAMVLSPSTDSGWAAIGHMVYLTQESMKIYEGSHKEGAYWCDYEWIDRSRKIILGQRIRHDGKLDTRPKMLEFDYQ